MFCANYRSRGASAEFKLRLCSRPLLRALLRLASLRKKSTSGGLGPPEAPRLGLGAPRCRAEFCTRPFLERPPSASQPARRASRGAPAKPLDLWSRITRTRFAASIVPVPGHPAHEAAARAAASAHAPGMMGHAMPPLFYENPARAPAKHNCPLSSRRSTRVHLSGVPTRTVLAGETSFCSEQCSVSVSFDVCLLLSF